MAGAQSRPTDAPQVVEVLYFTGCPNYKPLMHRLPGLLAKVGAHAVLTEREVASDEAAETERFLGSPQSASTAWTWNLAPRFRTLSA